MSLLSLHLVQLLALLVHLSNAIGVLLLQADQSGLMLNIGFIRTFGTLFGNSYLNIGFLKVLTEFVDLCKNRIEPTVIV